LTDIRTIALAGNPNSGKSTLFNGLTGLNQKTGNLPGVTVEKKSGVYFFKGQKVTVTDIPGLYSLSPRSPDGLISASLILDNTPEAPEVYIYIADATQLRKSLFLFYQMKLSGCPVILALNMADLALKRGLRTDIKKLEAGLQVPVVSISALKETGLDQLRLLVHDYAAKAGEKKPAQQSPEEIFSLIDRVLERCRDHDSSSWKSTFTDRVDKWVLHPVAGYLILFLVLFLLFQSVFSLAEYPMGWIEQGFAFLGEFLGRALPEGILHDLIVNGIVPGLSGVIMFLPQIILLFLFLSLLENTGYMVRAALLADRVMRAVGLSGRSVIPLLSGTACAIPAIMSARAISGSRQRLITMFITPLVSCSARLPVFVLLLSLLLPGEKWLGIFSYQAMALTLLYFLGFLSAFLLALLLNKGLNQEEQDAFLIEIPEYRPPHWKYVFMQIYEKSMSFVKEAGKVILSIAVLLWALSSYGPADFSSGRKEGRVTLEESFAGKGGKFIEPVIAPLGYDWKMGIALISSFAAREVFVGAMAAIYHIDDENNTGGIREKLQAEVNPRNGKKTYGPATVVSLLLFYLFALQCMSTLAVMRKETGGWKWPLIQFFSMGALAYISAFLAFQLLS
jgi:ferrous iron transport protein B